MIKHWYYFAKPNTMRDHTFNDDVAITKAKSREEAIKKFKKIYLYSDKEMDRYTYKLPNIGNGIYSDPFVLTDY